MNQFFYEDERKGWAFNNEEGEFVASVTGFDLRADVNPDNVQSLEDLYEFAHLIQKNVLRMLKAEFKKNMC